MEDESIEIDGVQARILILTCCQEWPILMGVPWGSCGKCGDKPSRR